MTPSISGDCADQPREFRITELVHALRRGIDRVLRGAVRRQMHVDGLARRSVEHRHLEAGAHAGVRHPHAGAARRGANAHALAGRQLVAAGEEAGREIDHLVEIVALDHAVMLEDRAIGGVRAGERGGVRGDGAAAGLGLADLGDDQRLAGRQGLVGGAAEFRRRLDVFEQQQEDVGLAFVEHVVEEVGGFEHGLVAGGDDVAERQIAPARAVEERKAEPAALRNHRHLAAERPLRRERAGAHVHRRAEGRAERGGDIGEAFRIGPAHRHVVARARWRAIASCMRWPASPGSSANPELKNDRGLDPGAAAALQLVRHELRRNDQDREIGRLRQVGNRRVGLAALHFAGAAAHRIDRAGVRVAQHHFQDAAAQALACRTRRRPRPPFSARAVFRNIRHRAPPFTASRGRAR